MAGRAQLMTGLPHYEQILLFCNIVVPFVVFLRLYSLRLVTTYPALSAYVLTSGTLTLLPVVLRLNPRGWHYATFYMVAEILSVILYLVMVLELYGSVLRDLIGIASAARRYMNFCITACIAGSVLLFAVEKQPHYVLERFYAVDRALVSSVALFVLFIAAFLAWFPVRVPRNAVIYLIGYAVFMVPTALALLVQNSGYYWRIGGIVALFAQPVSLSLWAVALNRAGETRSVSIARHWAEDDKVRIMSELTAINGALIRTARREPT